MRKKILTFFVLLFSLIGCLPLRSSVDVVDKFKENKELNINNRKYSNSETATNENSLMTYELTIEDNIVAFNEDICIIVEEVEAEYSYSASITNSTFFVQDTITINESSTEFKVKNNHASGEHSFDVNVISSDNEILYNKTIYIYSDGSNDYISASCFEESRDLYYKEVVADEEDLILLGLSEPTENIQYTKTEYSVYEEYQNFIYRANNNPENDESDIVCRKEYSSKSSDNRIKVNGYVEWTDKDENKHPLVYSDVYLLDNDIILDDVLGETQTDENGYFEFDISKLAWIASGANSLYVALYPSNNAAYVTSGVLKYMIISELYENVSDNKTITYYLTINNTGIRTGSYEVSQIMIYPYYYAMEMADRSLYYPPIYVYYPSTTDTSFCAPLLNTWGLNGVMGIIENDTHSWDAGTHEYGHYLEYIFNMTYLQLGSHVFGYDQSDEYNYRWFGNKLAWSEGLATYLGMASQLYFNLSELNIPGAGDIKYWFYTTRDNYFTINSYKKTEANEFSIAYFLLDLMDDDNSQNDTISLGHQEVWNLLTTRNNKNFSEFVELLDTSTVSKKNQIGLLEEYYGFSAKDLSSNSTLDLTYSNNTFSWSPNILGETLSKLSYYDLVFYSSDLSQTYKIENIRSETYTLSQNDLEEIFDLNTNIIYWQVIGYNDRYGFWDENDGLIAESLTGGDVSSLKEITKSIYNYLVGPDGTYYSSLVANDSVWYKIEAPVDGTYTFESTGDLDLTGELFENIVVNNYTTGRLLYDEDSGTAENFKFNYYLNEGQIIYLRVTGVNQYTSGTFNMKISINHNHSYTYYQHNSTSHKAICECGNESIQAHAVSAGGTSRFKPCLLCGYIVDTGTTPGIIGPMSSIKYKTNAGSYILPNGIIVLVDEDIEAYLNGTLEFNDSSIEIS